MKLIGFYLAFFVSENHGAMAPNILEPFAAVGRVAICASELVAE
jgi:hypothetical protein